MAVDELVIKQMKEKQTAKLIGQLKNMNEKKEIKERWKKYLAEHPQWCKKIGSHHYFRSRYSSKFWLHELLKSNQER